ncbi:MAG TPA: CoA transferase, partial [Methylomirabilota bacterium]|nr:CoA transferase [Methylomirabilota bacterium]
MALPLEGIVVADLTQNVAGPFCTQILGDMGAEVVKVERPGRGDDARAWAPPWWGQESASFMAFNRNKKSLALDLKREGGVEILRRLVGRADVFVQSLRAGAVAELGLDFAAAAALNPRLVYCSITAFGTEGPLRDLPGYDPLMQAYGGLMSVNGHPGEEPARVGTSIVDMGTGMWAALGIVAALRQRDATGRGVEVTTALFETALMWVSYHAMGYFASGDVPQPQGSGTGMIAPYQAFPTADGYVM